MKTAFKHSSKHYITAMFFVSAGVGNSVIKCLLIDDELFKLVNTRDENLSDSLNERQTVGNYTLEPKLNLVDQQDNYAKINYLSDNDYD